MNKLNALIIFLLLSLAACGSGTSASPQDQSFTYQFGINNGKLLPTQTFIDKNNNFLVVGWQQVNHIQMGFLRKYNPRKTLLWQKFIIINDQQTRAWGVTQDLEGNIYISGYSFEDAENNGVYGFLQKLD